MTISPDNISLWIVAFRREEALCKTINGWMNSFPFNDINVIMNDPNANYFPIERAFPQVNVWPNIWRASWETGAIAWCWNQAMRHTFETRDLCLMSQDDVEVAQGWPDLISDNYWTYVAPAGDTVQLQSIEGFSKVGWFDERFRAIGGPEADYLLRMIQTYPDELSAHDEHVWQMRHNDVGLADYWKPASKEGEVGEIRRQYNEAFADDECFTRWEQKWGDHVDTLFCRRMRDGAWRASVRQPGWEEINWYPAFTRRLKEMGRI